MDIIKLNYMANSLFSSAKNINLIPGGLADHSKKHFNPKSLQKGKKVEMEHTNDPNVAEEIAKDHLTEDKNYYEKLEKCVEAFHRFAQDPQLDSPNVTIQPGKPEANAALDILKLWNPQFFQGTREIVIGPSPNYGFVESGPNKDPSIIYLNADRIVAESGQQNGKAAALATAEVIAHEKGHIDSYDPSQGFQGGESPAEQKEQEFRQWLNSGGLQQVESLPSYQSLPG